MSLGRNLSHLPPRVIDGVRSGRPTSNSTKNCVAEGNSDLSHFLRKSEIRRGLRLVGTDPTQTNYWELRVRELPEVGFFHSAAWAAVLKDFCGVEPIYLVLLAQDRTVGVLPIMEGRTVFTSLRGVSLPITDFCSAVTSDDSFIEPLLRAANSIGISRGWSYLEIRGGKRRDSTGDSPSVSFRAHTLHLPPDPALAFARFKPEVRTAIRKSISSGVSVSVAWGMDAVGEFYRLYLMTRKKHGLPPRPFRLFQAIHRHVLVGGMGMVILARWRGRVIAAGVFLRYGDAAVFKYGASDPASLRVRPNDLVMWKAIEWYVERGVKSLHMGRTSMNNCGLRRFKSGWGAREEEIRYVRRSCRTGRVLTVRDRASGWHNQVLRSLPIPLLKGIGAVTSQYAV